MRRVPRNPKCLKRFWWPYF